MLQMKMIFRLGLGRIQHIFEITGTVSSKQVNSKQVNSKREKGNHVIVGKCMVIM